MLMPMDVDVAKTPLEIVRELFPKNLNSLVAQVEEHDIWIKCKIKGISARCLSLFQQEQGDRTLDQTETKDILRSLEILDDYSWEHLNTGHWKNISPHWRRLKSIVSLLKTAILVTSFPDALPQEIIKVCDQGLLMGSPFFMDNILAVLAERMHSLIQKTYSYSSDFIQVQRTSDLESNFPSTSSSIELKFPTLVKLKGPSFTITRLSNPSLEVFISQHFKPNQPLLLENIIDNWPALKLWSPEYIVKVGGERTVPVEVGSKYTSEDWTQKLMTIREFVTQFMGKSKSVTTKKGKCVGYLAQYQLFDQLPELRKDIKLPDYCLVGKDHEDNVEINAWFGPAHTLTPTHYDSRHNLLAQVFGTKFVRLFPTSESCNLYPHPSDSLLFNTSQIDLEDPKVSENFPKVRNASYSDFYLTPGVVLYIPPTWWHAVQSLSPSFSVSFWFD